LYEETLTGRPHVQEATSDNENLVKATVRKYNWYNGAYTLTCLCGACLGTSCPLSCRHIGMRSLLRFK